MHLKISGVYFFLHKMILQNEFTKWLKRYEIEFMYHKQLQNIKKKKKFRCRYKSIVLNWQQNAYFNLNRILKRLFQAKSTSKKSTLMK